MTKKCGPWPRLLDYTLRPHIQCFSLQCMDGDYVTMRTHTYTLQRVLGSHVSSAKIISAVQVAVHVVHVNPQTNITHLQTT